MSPGTRPNLYPQSYQPLMLLTRATAVRLSGAVPVRLRSGGVPALKKLPRTPLFLRPSIHAATLLELRRWRSWARDLALSAGPKFAALDNGPDAASLCREIDWLLQDAVDGHVADHFLRTDVDGEDDARGFRLRTRLDELYGLWGERIEKRKPFQYVVGCEHWRDVVLAVEEGVLIPRPETEKMVELVENLVFENARFREGFWADLGTGSGALAVGIGRLLEGKGRVIAVDLSAVAIAVAAYNVERYGLKDRVEVRQGSWFEPLEDVKGKLDGLVSNPPYIPSSQISGLQAEVGKHEPRCALDGGENGSEVLLHLCQGSASALRPGGFVTFETNGGEQAEIVANALRGTGFHSVNVVPDFAGILRFVTGFRS